MNYVFRGAIIGGFIGALLFFLMGIALSGCAGPSPSDIQRALEPARATAFGWTRAP